MMRKMREAMVRSMGMKMQTKRPALPILAAVLGFVVDEPGVSVSLVWGLQRNEYLSTYGEEDR